MEKSYLPEGKLFQTGQNAESISSLAALEIAAKQGVILEARAVLCDSYHNLHVDLGVCRGIIPKSEAVYSPSGDPVKDIAIITRVGKYVCFKVTEIVEEDGEPVAHLSRRLAQKECSENYVSQLSCGDIIDVCITHVEKFGAFCDIGCGMTALLPIDCISVSRISHPAERFSSGQMIKCAVRDIERDICRVTLTHKELLGTWLENAALFEPGETVVGVVRSVEPYGIFVELTPNLAGLAEWCEGVDEGAYVAVYIKSIIPEKMKVKLVIVDYSDQPYDKATPRYFIDAPFISHWQYSPDECSRNVSSYFLVRK